MKTYYWNSEHNLGGGKNAVKLGDRLPERYADDPRLQRWIDNRSISLDVPSRRKEDAAALEKLQVKNLELQEKIEQLTARIQQSDKVAEKNNLLTEQNKSINDKLDRLLLAKMESDSSVSDVISALRADVLSRSVKDTLIETLEQLQEGR